MGMGKIGKERLRLYHEKIKALGYKSLSSYIVDVMDRELSLDLPRGPRRSVRQPVGANINEQP
jgi:hypothetical protein